MNLERIAWETHDIVKGSGEYAVDGRVVKLDVADCVRRTCLFTPEALAKVPVWTRTTEPRKVEVTVESTVAAARRLASPTTMVLNFASARHVGGGWLSGANAQEESLCRASALSASLESQPDYYKVNRACPTALYTDHIIFSGRVPFFRDDEGEFLAEPFHVSVITCPAPNAGSLPRGQQEVGRALRRRSRDIVALATHLGCETLILGAWGCGVFRNEPDEVAAAFKEALDEVALKQAVFAILGPDGVTHEVFRQILASSPPRPA